LLSKYDVIGWLAVRDLAHATEFHASKRSWFESPDETVLPRLRHAGVRA